MILSNAGTRMRIWIRTDKDATSQIPWSTRPARKTPRRWRNLEVWSANSGGFQLLDSRLITRRSPNRALGPVQATFASKTWTDHIALATLNSANPSDGRYHGSCLQCRSKKKPDSS